MASTSKGCSEENANKLSTVNSSSSTDEDDNNPLNCASKKFDPLKALYSTEVERNKNYKQYNNLAHFESALKRAGIELVGSRSHKIENTNTSTQKKNENRFDIPYRERRFLPHQMPVQGGPAKKPKHSRNLFKYMEEVKGPLSALKQKLINNQKIYVYTRKEHGIRGIIIGNLIAFDKHWNLLLENVYETWRRRKHAFSQNNCTASLQSQDCTERLRNLGITLPETKVESLNRKYVEITRYYKQIMIRGEQIVLICEKLLNKKENKT